jgi:hypothetical protein
MVGAIDPLSTMSRRHQLKAVPTTATTARPAQNSSRAPPTRRARDRTNPAPRAIHEAAVATAARAGFCPGEPPLSAGLSGFMMFQPLETR